MSPIVIDAPLREQLKNVRDSVEFIDDAGHVLGFFRPIPQPPYDPKDIPPISDEERRRRAAQPGKYTTEEVLRHLESL